MSMKQIIIEKLTTKFQPSLLRVHDESDLHKGHAGYREGGDSHFRVQIAAAALEGKLRVQQHRAIMDCLSKELEETIHALAIEVLKSPKV